MSDILNKDAATLEVSLGKPSILVVDDDEAFLDTVQHLFILRGFDVDIARTPEEATRLLQENGRDKYQLIATDVDFGDLSAVQGDEFILKNANLFGGTRTVIITGAGWLTSKRHAELQKAGVSFLEKSPALIKKLEEITREENKRRASDISRTVSELLGQRANVKIKSAETHPASTLADMVKDRLKRTLTSWLRASNNPDQPIFYFQNKVYSPDDIVTEISNETEVGLELVRMLLREFEQSLGVD